MVGLGWVFWGGDSWKCVRRGLGACTRSTWRKPPGLEHHLCVFSFRRLYKVKLKQPHYWRSFAFVKGMMFMHIACKPYTRRCAVGYVRPSMEKTCPKAFLVHQDKFSVRIPLPISNELQTGQASSSGKVSLPPYPANACSVLLRSGTVQPPYPAGFSLTASPGLPCWAPVTVLYLTRLSLAPHC